MPPRQAMLSLPAMNAEYSSREVQAMHDATNTNEDLNGANDEAQAEVQGHGIRVPDFGPTLPTAGFELETLGSTMGMFGPSVAPGHPVGAPAVPLGMRKAGSDTGKAGIIGVL